MPLTRYQIRNEYSLADPELYRAADKDDPEALLEGVAMAGLVGVLRQLGDLAEFAAEIFHDLHEEVMATAARGHGLMIRVQQLEAEVPSIEKAFLSQTNHTSFFSNSGVEWHPNMRMEQNLVTRGDLPRCVMDSYEECRGPPRLFLLDKFDVAGAGACLKRYTDPSLFKAEAASSDIPSVEGQREKKIRKVKKKGSRWRNGETPEIVPTSHAKLHQLFLEERVEKGQSDPARLVKLKKRQLNASPFDSRSRKSYMEKFLESSPESNEVHEISVHPLPLKLTSGNSSESGLEIYDINTVSPVKKSSQGKESICSSPNAQEEVLKPSIEQLYGEAVDRQIVKISEPVVNAGTNEVPSVLHKDTLEKEIAVDRGGKSEGSIDGDQSDDMVSEVDNYMDALATMESEMETDNEYRLKTDMGFSNVKHGIDSDRNEEQSEFEANFSDSQSVGNFSTSDEGNSSFKKGRSSISYSDTHSNLAENTPSDNEGGAKVSTSLGTFATEIKETPSDQLPAHVEIQGTKSHDLVLPTDMCIDENNTPDLGESFCNSSSVDSNPIILPSDPETISVQNKLDETPSESMKSGYELSNIDKTEANLVDSSSVVSDMPLQVRDDINSEVCMESHPVDEINSGDPNVSSDGLLSVSNNLELAPEKTSGDNFGLGVVQTHFVGNNSTENMVHARIGSTQSITSTAEEQFHCSTIPEVEVDSGSLLDISDVVKHADLASKVDGTLPTTDVNLENSTSTVNSTEVHLETSTSQTLSFKDQQLSHVSDSAQVELDSTEKAALSSEEEAKLEEISRTADSEKVDLAICKVDAVEGGAVSLEHPSNCPDVLVIEDCVGLHDAIAENVDEAENMAVSAGSIAAPDDFPPSISADDGINDIVCSSPEIVCSLSSDPVNLQESRYGIGESNQEELDIQEPVSPECARGSETEKEISQLDVASKDTDPTSCKLVSSEDSNLEMVDGVHNLSLADANRNSLPAGDVTIAPESLEASDHELPSKYPHQAILPANREYAISSPTGNLPDTNSSLEQSLEWQADQCDVKTVKAEESSFKLSNHPSERIQSPSLTDQGRCFNDTSVSCQEDLPIHPSPSEYVPQSTGNKINSTEQVPDTISTALPGFGLLNGANPVNIEEMPPLPPLPPMQWRLGKFQNASLFSQREVSEHNQESFPSILPVRDDEKVQITFQAPQRGIMQPANPFLSLTAFEDEESHASEQVVGNELPPTLSSMQLPTMVNSTNTQQNSLAIEEIQSLNPFSTVSEFPNGKPEYDFFASEGETVQSTSNPFLPMPTVENTAFRQDSDTSQGKLIHPLNQLASEALEDNVLQQHTSRNSEKEHRNPCDTSVVPPIMVGEQPQYNLPTSETESLWSSNSSALQHPSHNSEEELQNPSDTAVLPPRKIDEQPQHNLPTSQRQLSRSSNPFALQHISQNSAEEHWNASNTFVLPPREVEEQPQHGLRISERESSWSSNPFALLPTSEAGKTNGSSITKLPRPRNPLIDAVAALDKSKLRKVTERDRPQNVPKVDERDSLLEQIRSKSFSLKPAVVARPSIQGPTTNLKVAAILEKANAIRQATAGSDEDDEDGWSDY